MSFKFTLTQINSAGNHGRAEARGKDKVADIFSQESVAPQKEY